MTKSLNRKIALLKNIKPFITQKALAQVGASLIISSTLYAAPVWGATTKANIQKMQSLQTMAARTIVGEAWQRGSKTTGHPTLIITTFVHRTNSHLDIHPLRNSST